MSNSCGEATPRGPSPSPNNSRPIANATELPVKRFTDGIRRQATFVVIGDGITTMAVLISGMILARLMPQEYMGTYRQVQYLTLLGVSIAEFGASQSIYRFWRSLDDSRRAVYAKMLVLFSVVSGLFTSLILISLAPLLSRWYQNDTLLPALVVSSLYPLSAIPLMMIRPVLISGGRSLAATFIETGLSLAQAAGIVVPIALGASLLQALVVWITVCLLRLVVVPVVLRSSLRSKGVWYSSELLKQVLGFLWPIQLSRLPGLFIAYVDKVAMSLLLTPAHFAIYSLGARELPFVGSIGASVSSILVPRLVDDRASGNTSVICERWRRAALGTALLTYPVAAFAIVYAVPVCQFLFSVTYRESAVPFAIYSTLTFVRVLEYASLAKVFDYTPLILQASLFSAVVMSILAFSLTWAMGMAGMASAVVLSAVAGATYLLMGYRRLLEVSIRSLLPVGRLVVVAVIGIAASLTIRALFEPLLSVVEDSSFLVLGWRLATHFALVSLLYLAVLKAINIGRFSLDRR